MRQSVLIILLFWACTVYAASIDYVVESDLPGFEGQKCRMAGKQWNFTEWILFR